MRHTLLFTLLAALLFVSCKKKDTPNNTLQFNADQIKIYPLNIYGRDAVLSFVEMYPSKSTSATFQIKKHTETEWTDISYTDKNNIPVGNLTTKTQYDTRVVLKENGSTAYSPVVSFTTQSYGINYARFFDGPSNMHDDANGLFSIEGAKYTIYGSGFTNESSISVKLVAIDNFSDVVILSSEVVNDSTLTFEIPKDLIRNDPYLRIKIYSCIIGDVPLTGYKSYLEHNYHVSGDFYVTNKDIVISKVSVTPYACKLLDIDGYFGTHETETKSPAYVYGVSLLMKERKVRIFRGTDLVKEINIHPFISASCDGDGYAAPDQVALARTMLQYHEVTALSLRTSLPSGNYTMQVRQVTLNGTVLLSNVFPFSL